MLMRHFKLGYADVMGMPYRAFLAFHRLRTVEIVNSKNELALDDLED